MARVAVVTGASSGLGRGLALALASEGWKVGLLARRAGLLDEVAAEAAAGGGRGLAVPVDVTDREGVRSAVARVEGELGPVGLLVANAGIPENGGARGLDGERVRRVFEVNLLGTVHAVEAVLPGMLERGDGQIAGVSSIAGFRGLPNAPAYSASKAAMTAFLEALRADLAGSGVAVTVLQPGYVRTAMTDRHRRPPPFLMELDDAVEVMMRAIRRRRRAVAFPRRLALLARLGRILPAGLYDALAGRGAGRRRRGKREEGPGEGGPGGQASE